MRRCERKAKRSSIPGASAGVRTVPAAVVGAGRPPKACVWADADKSPRRCTKGRPRGAPAHEMKINVSLPTGSVVSPEVEGSDTVDSVTHKVHHLAREPKPHPAQQILHFAGQRLERRQTLAFYKIGKEAQLQLRVIPQTQVIRLNIRGTLIETTLDTLLAEPSSLLYLMFEPMVQGGEPVNAAAARSGGRGGLTEAVPHQYYGGRPGPLPCEDGIYFIDSDPLSFTFITNYLCELCRQPHTDGGMMEPEPEGSEKVMGVAASPVPPVVPDSPAARAQLALDAWHYELRALAEACAAKPTGGSCHSLASLVEVSGPLLALNNILALSDVEVGTLLGQLSVNVVLSARIKADIAAEKAKRQAALEAERAVQAFCAALAKAECPVSEAGARALHMGIAIGELYEMDAATAQRRAGVSAEDAQLIGALERNGEFECLYPGAAFGEGGVLHSIGTDYGQRAWVNPHIDGKVIAVMSSIQHGAPHKFVGRSNDGQCYTKHVANSWMSVDLGAARTVVPTHYCLRSSGNSSHVVRHWTLEGKAADAGAKDWQEIRRHDNDATMAAQDHSVGAWPVDAGGRAFRHLRIRQHGKNPASSNGSDYLMCCGFEVYGTLLDAEA